MNVLNLLKNMQYVIRAKGRILLIVVVFLTPMLIYMINFWGVPLSKSTSEWRDFGGYVSGIYSVLLALSIVYLTNSLNRKYDRDKECRVFIKKLYGDILDLDHDNVDIKKVNSIVNSVFRNRLYLNDYLYSELIKMTDYYKEISNDKSVISLPKEEEMLLFLRKYYNER